jgi:hypothetical protein
MWRGGRHRHHRKTLIAVADYEDTRIFNMTESSPLLITDQRVRTVRYRTVQAIYNLHPAQFKRAFTLLISPPTFGYFSQHSSISQKANGATTIVGQQNSANTHSNISADWTAKLHHCDHTTTTILFPHRPPRLPANCFFIPIPNQLNTPIPQYLA